MDALARRIPAPPFCPMALVDLPLCPSTYAVSASLASAKAPIGGKGPTRISVRTHLLDLQHSLLVKDFFESVFWDR
jgi:hypothetical protein